MQRRLIGWTGIVAVAGGFLGCAGTDGKVGEEGPQGTAGRPALVRVSEEAPGASCATGGLKIEAGQDANGDGLLDDSEVLTVEYACQGGRGKDGAKGGDGGDASDGALVGIRVSAEPPGGPCVAGGKKIEVGADADGDGLPDDGAETSYVCDGAVGANGAGRVSTMAQLTDEPAGAHCAAGGKRVEYGLDANEDGVLSGAEVAGVTFVCDGSDGAHGAQGLVVSSIEPPSANCQAGGTRLDFGLDVDADGVLDGDEILETRFVCDGVDGADAKRSLVYVSVEAPGPHCAAGGQRIETGVDADGDQSLDSAEIAMTQYLCDGEDGVDGTAGADARLTLVEVGTEPAGANCAAGGYKIVTGVDTDGDLTLSAGEIRQTEYVCNGIDGAAGADGADARVALVHVSAEPPGPNCAAGGSKVESGLDHDGDGILAGAEIDDVDYVCNGEDGADGNDGSDGVRALVVVTAEPPGAHCAAGGQKIEAGADLDGDLVLDLPAELQSTRYVCNGEDGNDGANGSDGSDGKLMLVSVTAEPAGANCVAGGQKIEYGADDDGDANLDVTEVQGTRYVCNGQNGADAADGDDGSDALVVRVVVTSLAAGPICPTGGRVIEVGLDDDRSGALDPGEVDSTSYVCNGTGN